ncbi:hypothetical protein DNTS_014587 [Danionella cerebrum]|uniref:Uncharacterized protein n=1 Tax=Danionella cerebrum TaxID=2873325 RepID=A0A553Q768_9TELE|nr:hypothetical protein DNTS_014587 [Danionella translucida]
MSVEKRIGAASDPKPTFVDQQKPDTVSNNQRSVRKICEETEQKVRLTLLGGSTLGPTMLEAPGVRARTK